MPKPKTITRLSLDEGDIDIEDPVLQYLLQENEDQRRRVLNLETRDIVYAVRHPKRWWHRWRNS